MPAQDQDLANIEALVCKAQAGDEASFEALFEFWFDRVYRYTAYRVEAADCEDLVSDIFLKVVQKLKTYTSRTGVGFGAWLFRLAHNTIIDHYRRKKELLGSDLVEEAETDFFAAVVDQQPRPDDLANSLYDYERVYGFLKKLTPNHREVLELKFLEGFSTKEVAVVMNTSEGNVRIMQLRALKEMRQYLQRDEN